MLYISLFYLFSTGCEGTKLSRTPENINSLRACVKSEGKFIHSTQRHFLVKACD